jgi:hypothetical protein
MDADLDTLCIVVYCTADDFLPEKPGNARRRVTDAEVATLCVAQAIMGIPSDRRFLAVARKRLCHLFPELPQQPGFHKRRARLAETVEWLIGVFAATSPGSHDDALLIDSTPVECARSVETTRRSALADAADYGWCASHSRFFWGFRLHGLFAPDGTPRAFTLASPKRDEREVGIELLARAERVGGETVIGDKGYAGREFAAAAGELKPPSSGRPAKTSPTAPFTSPRSVSGSSRSSGPARTSSPSSATALAPCTTCAPASPSASWRWLHASPSTTGSAVRAAPWSTASPEGVESTI